ncbi:MAG: hypothetical protein AMXMBFR34_27580 [Myxococcaceae bacterium]
MASLYLQDRSITVDKMGFRPVQWCSAQSLTPEHGAALTVRDNQYPVLRLADSTSPQPRGYCVLPVPSSRSSTSYTVRVYWATDAVTGTVAWIVGHASLPVGTALPTTSSNHHAGRDYRRQRHGDRGRGRPVGQPRLAGAHLGDPGRDEPGRHGQRPGGRPGRRGRRDAALRPNQ